jgi:small redox-active disulfide protein 2
VFVSRIPSRDELIAAIQDRINRKMRSYFRRRTATVVVLGGGCQACEETLENVRKAITELGIEVAVEHVTEPEEIARYGVDETPAVLMVEQSVKASGKVPKVEIIKEWLKDLHL